MHIYKVIFVLDTIYSCRVARNSIVMDGNLTYQVNRGQLIYALIKTDSEKKAREIAEELIAEISKKGKVALPVPGSGDRDNYKFL